MELEMMKWNLECQLREMAKTVERQQEMIAMAKRDPLTGLRNRQGIPELVNARLRKQSGSCGRSCGRSCAGSSRLEG